MQIKGQVAFVVGGASGLGQATARRLAAEGARIVVFDRDNQGVARIADEVGGHGVACDIADDVGCENAINGAINRVGPPRILVNCAGVGDPGSTVGRGGPLQIAEFRKVININLVGTFNCLRLCAQAMSALPALDTGERGVIINTSSIAAVEGMMGQVAYSASKGGVAAMTLPLARELGRFGIRVLDIAPGLFETPMTLNLPEKSREVVFAMKPPFPTRPGDPAEYAALVVAIVTNPMLNGTMLRLDGALRAPPRY
ncbi:MAG: SDR family NAD(P)-dependent oxidoreductase [Roseiarcus sp.]